MNCLLTRQPPLTRILMTARMAGPKSFLNLQHRTRSAAMIQLPPLPFAKDALSPHISAEAIVRSSEGKIFNNAAQVWNHTFYWNCLSPNAAGRPAGALLQRIEQHFGSFEQFRTQFTETAVSLFGSGWAWLVQKPNGTLELRATSNAGTPLMTQDKPLLTCDVWEHAYYIDWRNARPKYVEAFWKLANWDFVAKNMRD